MPDHASGVSSPLLLFSSFCCFFWCISMFALSSPFPNLSKFCSLSLSLSPTPQAKTQPATLIFLTTQLSVTTEPNLSQVITGQLATIQNTAQTTPVNKPAPLHRPLEAQISTPPLREIPFTIDHRRRMSITRPIVTNRSTPPESRRIPTWQTATSSGNPGPNSPPELQ